MGENHFLTVAALKGAIYHAGLSSWKENPRTYEELNSTVHRQPFEPFRLVLTIGGTHEVRHPDLIMVGQRSAIIGLTKNPDATVYDKGTIKVDLLHIVAIQNLAVKMPAPNGPAA